MPSSEEVEIGALLGSCILKSILFCFTKNTFSFPTEFLSLNQRAPFEETNLNTVVSVINQYNITFLQVTSEDVNTYLVFSPCIKCKLNVHCY